MNDKNRTLLVTGATGKLGQQVVDLLLNEHQIDPERLILTSRKPDALAELSARGVKVRAADFENADSLKEAFAGADALLLISIDAVGRRIELHTNAMAAAEAAGVQHLVYTSMPAPETSPLVFAPEHRGTEARIASSTLPSWSVLRNNWYFENLLEFQASILSTGQWLTLTGDAAASHISRRDLARAAAAALLEAPAEKRTLTLVTDRPMRSR